MVTMYSMKRGLSIMSEEEIVEFTKCFKKFMDRADVEMINYFRREAQRSYNLSYYKVCAENLNVSLDYYMQELL